jgi:hypothetical protein
VYHHNIVDQSHHSSHSLTAVLAELLLVEAPHRTSQRHGAVFGFNRQMTQAGDMTTQQVTDDSSFQISVERTFAGHRCCVAEAYHVSLPSNITEEMFYPWLIRCG